MNVPTPPPLTGWFLLATMAAVLVVGSVGAGGAFFLIVRYGARSVPPLVAFLFVCVASLVAVLDLIQRRQGV